MFAAFARLPPRDNVPVTKVVPARSARRTVLICVMVLSLLGVLMLEHPGHEGRLPGAVV